MQKAGHNCVDASRPWPDAPAAKSTGIGVRGPGGDVHLCKGLINIDGTSCIDLGLMGD